MKIPINQYWALLKKYIIPQWERSLLLGLLLFGNIGLQLINPRIIRNFIDTAQLGGESGLLLQSALLFLALAMTQQIVTVLASYTSEIVAWTATNNLRIDLTNHCLCLDLSFHNAHSPGEMIERLDSDVNNLANFFSRFVIELLGSTLLMFGILIMMWRENWLVGLGLTVFIAIGMFIILRYRNVAIPYWTAERQASADFYGFLEERLSGTVDIRANGAEAYVLRQFHGFIREMLRTSLKSAMVINVLININQFLFAAGTAAAFAIGAFLFQGEVITIGTVYLIYSYTSMLNRPMDNIAHQIEELQRAGAGIVRIQELLAIKNRVKSICVPPSCNPTRLDSQQDKGKIASLGKSLFVHFDQVTFGYDDSVFKTAPKTMGRTQQSFKKEYVLHDISFTLEPGKVLGLLGRTGSGKSTLSRLIFRFYDPDVGAVFISGNGISTPIDIRQLPLVELREQVGMVTQNIQLFNATVRDNLTFFDPTISDEKIQEIISGLGLTEWFLTLPDGFNTVLDSGGGGLSAGEAQLLAFARVFLVDPGLVVLDEASSRLDPLTEALIEQAVDRLVTNRTAIIIAHRLGTVQKADEIMILDQGRIKEYGNRIELVRNPLSMFSKLLETGLEEVLV